MNPTVSVDTYIETRSPHTDKHFQFSPPDPHNTHREGGDAMHSNRPGSTHTRTGMDTLRKAHLHTHTHTHTHAFLTHI